jgi:hypothetical protein
VIIDGSVPDAMIADMVEDSYDLVVSKLPRLRRGALAWRGDARADSEASCVPDSANPIVQRSAGG